MNSLAKPSCIHTSSPNHLETETFYADLNLIQQRLLESENVHAMLRAAGYGKSWMSLKEIAELVPPADKRTQHQVIPYPES